MSAESSVEAPPTDLSKLRLTPTGKILTLISQFNCLARKGVSYQPGTGNFDALQYEKNSRAWSSGERQAALFVLAVWSGSNWIGKGKAFDLVHAVSTLDRHDIEVIVNWMREPFWL